MKHILLKKEPLNSVEKAYKSAIEEQIKNYVQALINNWMKK